MTTHDTNLTNDAAASTGAETAEQHDVAAEAHVSKDTVETIAESDGATIVVGSDPVEVILHPVTEGGETEVVAEGGETEVVAEGGETEVVAEGGETEVVAEGGETEVIAEGGETEVVAEGGEKGDGKGRRSRRGRRRGKGGKNRRDDRQPRDRSDSLLKQGERFDYGVFVVVETHKRMPFGTLGRVMIELPVEEGQPPKEPVEERGMLPLRGLRLIGANIGRMSEAQRTAALINRQSSIKLGFAKKLADGQLLGITDAVIAESEPEEREAMVTLGFATKEEFAGEEGKEPKIVYKAVLTDAEVDLVRAGELEVVEDAQAAEANSFVSVLFPAVMVERPSKQGPRLIEIAEYERRERVARRNAEKAAYEHDKAILTALAASREPFQVVVQNIGRADKKKEGGQGPVYGLFCRIPGTERDGLIHVSHVVGGRAAVERVEEGKTVLTVIISQPIKEVKRRERDTFQIELSEREATEAQSELQPGFVIPAQVADLRAQERVAPSILLRADGQEFILDEDELDGLSREALLRVKMTRVAVMGESTGKVALVTTDKATGEVTRTVVDEKAPREPVNEELVTVVVEPVYSVARDERGRIFVTRVGVPKGR